MKNLIILLSAALLFSCSSSNDEGSVKKTKIVCADSIETEMFDELGNAFTVKVPGPCDTIEVSEEVE